MNLDPPIISVEQVEQAVLVVDVDGRPMPGGTAYAPCVDLHCSEVHARIALDPAHPTAQISIMLQPDNIGPVVRLFCREMRSRMRVITQRGHSSAT